MRSIKYSLFPNYGLFLNKVPLILCCLIWLPVYIAHASEAGFPGKNVNVIGPPPAGSGAIPDNGLRQQNEPSCAVNPVTPSQICCGFNDYRGIDIPEIGDAWEGLACSRDGGQSWNSQLIPGHRGDLDYSLNLDFAADPNLVSAPGGLFYNFIASDRSHIGGIYVQRFAWKNKEDGWPLIQVGGPVLINKGTSGRFIDKPHMIGFLDDDNNEKVTMTWDNAGNSESQNLPAGDLGMAAAVFVGNDKNDGTKILYWSSQDWGKTWDNPTKLTESKGVNSGINLASNGDNICATWRRFDDTNEISSILFACSSDRGKRFGKPKVIYESMCPFDQVTLNGVEPAPKDIVSFRSNAFPVIAGDGQKFYVFWSDRGFANASNGQAGCNLRTEAGGFNPSYGRIVYSVTGNNGKSWSSPQPVDDAPIGENALIGHQFMPAAFGANGEVVVTWIDNRDDIANMLDVDKQLIVDFWKDEDALYRHTTDIRSARLQTSGKASFTPSIKVSSYTKGLRRTSSGAIIGLQQMEFNLVNARLFQKGTAPFIGDYLSVTANAYNRSDDGKWVNSNTQPILGSPTFHITWGDNRDVRGNAWGEADSNGFSAPSPYTPVSQNQVNASVGDGEQIKNSTPTVEDPADDQQIQCTVASVKADRTRDQNIYSAPLYPLSTIQSPGAIKVTGQVQRALPLYLANNSFESRYFRLDITQQPTDYSTCTGSASFRQHPALDTCPITVTESVWVKIYAKSSAVRTIFVASTDPLPNVPVTLSACGMDGSGQPDAGTCVAVANVMLNNDPLELGGNLEQPDFDSINSILTKELHNPDLLNPDLLNPLLLNLLVQNPDLLNPDLLNIDLLNPDLLNPDLLNLVLANPDLLNSSLLTILVLNPDLMNPDLMNLLLDPGLDLLNLLVANPDLMNPDLLNLLVANPDLMNPDLMNDILANMSVENPDLMNPDLMNLIIANPDLMNPDLLNAELTNPDLMNPDLLNPDLMNLIVSNPDLMNPDLLNPDLLNPDLMNPDLLNPDLLNPDLMNPDLMNLILLNPDLMNPDLMNPDLMNPDLMNPDLLNPDLMNLLVANPDLMNPDLMNPDLLNPDLMNPDLLNVVISYSDIENPEVANADLEGNANNNYIDVTWQVKNDGNTTTGYMAQPFIAGPDEHAATQLIVSKPYLRQTTRNCNPVLESDNQVVVNIYNPPNQEPIINPNPVDNEVHGLASFWLAPGEVGNVTLRIFSDDPANLHSSRAGLYVNSEACNSEGVCDNQPFQITTRQADFDGPILVPLLIGSVPTVEATSPDGGIVLFDSPTAFDEGDNSTVPVTCTFESGSLVPLGEHDNICTAEDSVGNASSTNTFTLEVLDTTAPLIYINPPAETFPIEATGVQGAQVNFEDWATASDLVDETVVVTCPDSGGWFPLGDTSVTCTAMDDSGNAGTETLVISVADTEPPVIIVPEIATVAEATGPEGATVIFSVTASDIADPAVALVCSTESGGVFGPGTTVVTCVATDFSGNSTTASFDVIVEDTIAPVITVTGNIEVEATSTSGASVSYSVSVFDAVDNEVLATCTPVSGSSFPLGITNVNCYAMDGAGNQSSVSFTVTIVDTTSPVLTIPDPIILEATSPEGNVVEYAAIVTDVSDSTVAVSCSPASSTWFPIGVTVVSCNASDLSGNTSSGSFDVTIQDTTPPEITVPADIAVSAQTNSGAIVNFVVTASDIADAEVEIVCTPASGSTFDIGTTGVECIATDNAGLTTSDSFNVTVNTGIIWIEPIENTGSGFLGANFNFRWGYGADGVLFDSSEMIDKQKGKGTAPLMMNYLGATCLSGNPEVVDLDAGNSSLRYSNDEWQLNWQTGQSLINGQPITAGCYELVIPRADGQGSDDMKRVLLTN